MSKDEMDKFEQKKMTKIRPIKNTWYDWLINYIPEPIRKSVGGFKDKIVILQCSCKNRWYLQRYCRRCWKKIWNFKFWIRQIIA